MGCRIEWIDWRWQQVKIDSRTCTSFPRHWILHCTTYNMMRKGEGYHLLMYSWTELFTNKSWTSLSPIHSILVFPVYFCPLLNGESGSGHLIRSFLLLISSFSGLIFLPGPIHWGWEGGKGKRKNGHSPARSPSGNNIRIRRYSMFGTETLTIESLQWKERASFRRSKIDTVRTLWNS